MQQLPKIADVVVDLPLDGPFDYAIPADMAEHIKIGQRVRVLFNRRKTLGLVVGFKEKSSFKKLNSIISILDEGVAFPSAALKLGQKMSDYYGCSLGEALAIQLPIPLRKDRALECGNSPVTERQPAELPIVLASLDYQKRLGAIIEAMTKCFANNRQVIFLVPEINQLAFLNRKLKEAFQSKNIVCVKHPASVQEEIDQWLSARDGKCDVLMGTRSAVFAPLPRLGLIVIWNEQNPSYKEEQSPHYRANEVALFRREVEGCQVILTLPVVSSEWVYQEKKKEVVIQKIDADHLATVKLVDMTNYNPRKSSIISAPLQRDIEKVRKEKGKVWFILLPQDFSPYFMEAIQREIRPKADKIIDEIKRFYPDAKVGRYDQSISPDVDMALTAPHALAFDYPVKPDLIAIINADRHLRHVDFRSGYYLYSLLMRLRALAGKEVVVQTQMRDYFSIAAAIKTSEKLFHRDDLKERNDLNLPPFKQLIEISFRGDDEQTVRTQAEELYKFLEEKTPKSILLSNPYTSTNQSLKLRHKVRYSIMLKSSNVEAAITFIKKQLKHLKRKSDVIMTINVNP